MSFSTCPPERLRGISVQKHTERVKCGKFSRPEQTRTVEGSKAGSDSFYLPISWFQKEQPLLKYQDLSLFKLLR